MSVQHSPRRRNPPAELDVSAELRSLREKVNSSMTGKFFHELNDIKSLAQQYQLDSSKMSSVDGNLDQDIAVGNDLIKKRIASVEREFFEEVAKLNERIDLLLSYVKENTRRIDEIEQDKRAASLIFQGVSEADSKPVDAQIIDIMKDKLGLFVPKYPCCEDGATGTENSNRVPPFVISRAFRMGKPRTAAQISKMGPRPIMVTFGSLFFRDQVFAAKRKLKNTKLFICESLTRSRYELLTRAREAVGVNNAWSMDGKIFIMVDNSKRSISKLEDLPRPT
jgi:hypothetical protein